MSDNGGSLTRDVELRLKVANQSQAGFKALTDQINTLTTAIDKEAEAASRGVVKQAELAESLKKLGDAGKGIQDLAKSVQVYQNTFTQIEAGGKKIDEAAAALQRFEESGSRNTRALRSLQSAYGNAVVGLDALIKRQGDYAAELRQAGINTDDLTGEIQRLLEVAGRAGDGIRVLTEANNNYTTNIRKRREEEAKAAAATEAAAQATRDLAAAQRAAVDAAELEAAAMGAVTHAAEAQHQAAKQAEADRIREREAVQQRANQISQDMALLVTRSRLEAEQRDTAAAETAAAERVRIAEQEAAREKQIAADKAKYAVDVQRRADEINRDLALQGVQARLQAAEREKEAARQVAAEQVRVAQEVAEKERQAQAVKDKAYRDANIGAAQINQELALSRIIAERTAREREAAKQREAAYVVEQNERKRREEADNSARNSEQQAMDRFNRYREQRLEGNRRVRDSVKETAIVENQRSTARAGTQPGFLGLPAYQVTNLGYQANDVLQGFVQGVSPITILAQQGPQIFQIFGMAALKWFPVIAAVVGTATVAIGALATGFRELSSNREFSAAITANVNLLRYNAETLTQYRKDIQDMGVSWKDAGAAIRTAMSGNIGQERFKELAQVAKDMTRTTGEEMPDAMKRLVTAFTTGEKGIRELNQSLGFLDDAGVKHLRNLYDQNKGYEAQEFALAKLIVRQKAAASEAMTPLDHAVEELNKSWNELLRTLSDSATISKLTGILSDFVGMIDKIVQGIDHWIIKQKELNEVPIRSQTGNANADAFIDAAAGLPPQRPPPRDATPAPGGLATGQQRVALPQTLKLDTPELTELVAALREVSKKLPEGYSYRVSDPGLHSKFVAGTNTVSEHYMRRALDIAVMDPEGRAVPGFMGRGGPLYTQMEQGVAEILANKNLGPVAQGTLFGKPDAGHISVGGREAEQQAIRTGLVDAGRRKLVEDASQKEKDDAADARRSAKEKYDLEQASSRARERALQLTIEERNVRDKFPNLAADEQKKLVIQNMASFDLKQRTEIIQEQLNLEQKALQNRTHAAEAEAAKQQAMTKAINDNVSNYKTVLEIGERAATNKEAELVAIDQENDRYKSLVKVIDDLRRGINQGQKTELEKQLDSIADKYKNLHEGFERARRQAPLTGRARIDELEQQLPGLQEQENLNARRTAAEETAKKALQTREQLIQSYTKLYEAGEITLEEKNQKTKEAFEATNKAILDGADALDKWADAAEKIGNVPAIEIKKARAEAQEFRAETKYLDPFWKGLKTTIEDSFGQNLTDAFNTVAESIGKAIAKTGEWKDVFISLEKAAGNFFAGILKDIATYIIKYEALKMIQATGLFGDLGMGAAASGAASAVGAVGASSAATATGMSGGWASILSGAAAIVHQGGIIGTTQLPQRPMYWFGNAPRFHNGGLAANEQVAILQTGEEVLTANNPRHANNYGGEINIRNVLVADPELVPSHMASARGEKIIMSTLTRNAATVRQLVR